MLLYVMFGIKVSSGFPESLNLSLLSIIRLGKFGSNVDRYILENARDSGISMMDGV